MVKHGLLVGCLVVPAYWLLRQQDGIREISAIVVLGSSQTSSGTTLLAPQVTGWCSQHLGNQYTQFKSDV
jgi:hypothetical protein